MGFQFGLHGLAALAPNYRIECLDVLSDQLGSTEPVVSFVFPCALSERGDGSSMYLSPCCWI